jgi:hypothetical protein
LISCYAPSDVAESIGRELLVYGRRIPKAEMFARIDAVDADTVRAVADRFIYDQDVAIAAVGDTQFLPDYNWYVMGKGGWVLVGAGAGAGRMGGRGRRSSRHEAGRSHCRCGVHPVPARLQLVSKGGGCS